MRDKTASPAVIIEYWMNPIAMQYTVDSDDKYHHFVWAGIRYYLLVIYKTVPQITNWLLQCTLILFECLTLFEVIKKRSWLLYNHRLKNPDTFCFCCFYSNSGFFSVLYVKSCHYNLHLNWKLLSFLLFIRYLYYFSLVDVFFV